MSELIAHQPHLFPSPSPSPFAHPNPQSSRRYHMKNTQKKMMTSWLRLVHRTDHRFDHVLDSIITASTQGVFTDIRTSQAVSMVRINLRLFLVVRYHLQLSSQQPYWSGLNLTPARAAGNTSLMSKGFGLFS